VTSPSVHLGFPFWEIRRKHLWGEKLEVLLLDLPDSPEESPLSIARWRLWRDRLKCQLYSRFKKL